MSPLLAQKLIDTYPDLFKDWRNSRSSRFQVGDGWFTLLDTACYLICFPVTAAQRRYDLSRAHEGQVRGDGLSIFSAVDVERARLAVVKCKENLPEVAQIKEKFGGLRFYVHGGTANAAAYIEFAEALSMRTCDVCGSPGTTEGPGWLRTRCDVHRETGAS